MDFKLYFYLSFVLQGFSRASRSSSDRRFIFSSSSKDVISCDFESSSICGYTQEKNDNFDWQRHTGTTLSLKTGPNYDHTLGSGKTGHYMYTEASSPRKPLDKARLTSRAGHSSTSAQYVSFYYAMYGDGMGTLNVYVDRGQTRQIPAFVSTGDHGSSWHYGCVNIPPQSTYKIIFEGIIGTNYRSDISIDDIKLQSGICHTSGHVVTTTKAPSGASVYSLSCNFEQGTCGYTQDKTDNREWVRHNGNTSSVSTGPDSDHTSHRSKGYYMYFESSSPALPGDKARLVSVKIASRQNIVSVKFWYHMYGVDEGSLNAYLKTGNTLGSPKFHVSGNQGNMWKLGCVEVPTGLTEFQLVFEAIRGKSYHGDIAIDDIGVSSLHCTSTSGHSTVKPHITTDPNVHVTIDITTPSTIIIGNATSSVTCNFDNEAMCGYSLISESSSIHYYWQWTGGQTANQYTGPSRDHTSGHGHYMAAVSLGTTSSLGMMADLFSPYFDTVGRQLKVQFWYNAYSSASTEFGGFKVYLDNNGQHTKLLFSESRAHSSTSWQQVCINLPTNIQHTRLLFQGIHGDGVHGDIALDDVTLSTGQCAHKRSTDKNNG